MPFIASRNIIALRDLLPFLYLFPFRKLATILPPQVTRLIIIPLIYVYGLLPINQKGRKSISEMIDLIFSHTKTRKDVKKLSRQYLRNSIYTIIDDIILNKLSKKDLAKVGVINGLENLEKALLDRKGVILVGGHFSGDRVSKLFLREIGFPILCVRAKSPAHFSPSMSAVEKKYLVPVRIDIMNNVLKDYVFVEDKGFGIEVLKRLRKNGLVSILMDAKARATMQGIDCSFLGSQRFFATNYLHLAHLTGAAVIPMLCIGNSSSFTVTFGENIELQHLPDKEEFISANLDTLVRMLEFQVLQYPTHWLMM